MDGVNTADMLSYQAISQYLVRSQRVMLCGEVEVADFETLEMALIVVSSPFSAPYIHGFITGVLCATPRGTFETSWQQVQSNIPFFGENQDNIYKLLNILHSSTAAQLKEDEGGIDLILPNDDYPLRTRLEGLVDWTEGFVEGIKFGTISKEKLLQLPLVKEVLMDLVSIQEMDFKEEDSEENEKDYAQIVEFVRVGVLLVCAECLSGETTKEIKYSSHIH